MIEIKDLSLRAGEFRLDHLSFTIQSGQYAVLMGKTGRGKTTILKRFAVFDAWRQVKS